jgi:hypothetical protein
MNEKIDFPYQHLAAESAAARLPQRQRWHVNCFIPDTIKEFAFWFTIRT